MDTKKIVDRKLSFMRMKPKVGKLKQPSSSAAAATKPLSVKFEPTEASTATHAEDVSGTPVREDYVEEDVKPDQLTERTSEEDRDDLRKSDESEDPGLHPALDGAGSEAVGDDVKPAIPLVADQYEERTAVPPSQVPDVSALDSLPSVSTSTVETVATTKKPRSKPMKPRKPVAVDGAPVVSGVDGDDEDEDEEEEVLEVSENNHPVENIMILKKLSNGRIRKKVVKSKLHDWKREALDKFASTDSEKIVTMRDLIFFRSSKDKKDDEIEKEDEQRDDILDDDPFASAALDDVDLNESNGPSRPTLKKERVTAEPAEDVKPLIPASSENDQENTYAGTELGDGDEEENDMSAPKVKIGADGLIVLDEESLVVRSTASLEADKMKNAPLIHDDSGSFLFVSEDRRKLRKEVVKAKEWSITELAVFYKALSIVGTDFSMMEALFKNRSRKELKLKFRTESRRNAELVDRALTGQNVQFDLTLLPEFKDEAEDEKPKEKKKPVRKKAGNKPNATATQVRKRRVQLVGGDSEAEEGSFEPERTSVREPPDGSWNTIDSIPVKKPVKKRTSKKRKTAAGEESSTDPTTSQGVTVTERVVSIDSPRVPTSLQPSRATETPVVEESGKTFAELRSPQHAPLPASPAVLRVRTTSTSSSGVGSPATGGGKIVIVATRTECPSCPKYHLYANDKQNFTDAELKDAVTEAMHRVQALRARNAALPSSAHSAGCPIFASSDRPSPTSAAQTNYRSKPYDNIPGLFQTLSPASPRVVDVRRSPVVPRPHPSPNLTTTTSDGSITKVQTTLIPPTQLA